MRGKPSRRQIAEFSAAVTRHLPVDEIDSETAQEWIDGPKVLAEILHNTLAPREKVISRSFLFGSPRYEIKVGGQRSTEEVIKASPYTNEPPKIVNSQFFPIRSQEEKLRSIAFLVSPFGVTPAEAIKIAKEKLEWEQPTYEDTFFFGEQWGNVARERPILFPHEPVKLPNGEVILCMYGSWGIDWIEKNGKRTWSSGYLWLELSRPENKAAGGVRFAFVEKGK